MVTLDGREGAKEIEGAGSRHWRSLISVLIMDTGSSTPGEKSLGVSLVGYMRQGP